MPMFPRIVRNYEPRGLEAVGELAGLSEGGLARAMLTTRYLFRDRRLHRTRRT
jgi:hypothetical protein